MPHKLFTHSAPLASRWSSFAPPRPLHSCQSPFAFRSHRPPVFSPLRTFAQRRYEYRRFGRAQQIGNIWRASPVFRIGVYATAGGGVVFYVTHIEEVPVTGRRRFNFIGPETAAQMGLQQYQQVLQQYQGRILPDWAPETKMAKRVLERLIPSSGIGGEWELHVVQDKEANAFVLPGSVLPDLRPFLAC